MGRCYWKARRKQESKNSRLCSSHFLPSDYLYPKRKLEKGAYLKKNAVPSVFGKADGALEASSPKRNAPAELSISPSKLATKNFNRIPQLQQTLVRGTSHVRGTNQRWGTNHTRYLPIT